MVYLFMVLMLLLAECAMVFKPTLENREVSRVVFRNVRLYPFLYSLKGSAPQVTQP